MPGPRSTGGTDGLFCNDFGGTSSATPLAAGVAALALSANSKLNDREVREILETTADKVGPKREYKANGRSRTYGFGQINAARAVALARKRSRPSSP